MEEEKTVQVSVVDALIEELTKESLAAEESLKPELDETPDPAFVAWAESAKFDAAALWESTRRQVAEANSGARSTMMHLDILTNLLDSLPRDLGEFVVRRTATSLMVSAGGMTRSIGVAAHNAEIASPGADVKTPSQSQLGCQGGTGSSSRIRVTYARKPEHQHLVNTEYQRTPTHPATLVLGKAAGLFTDEQYNSERGANGRRNKVASYFGWVRIG